MAIFNIKHNTFYSYSGNVIDGANLTRLHPINDDYQKVNSHFISITKNPFIETFFDFFNNRVGSFMLAEPHNVLNIISEIEVETKLKTFPTDQVDIKTQWNHLVSLKPNTEFIDFLKFITFDGTEGIRNLIESKNLKSKSPYQATLELCEYIYQNFEYRQGVTTVSSKLDDVWQLKAGVCQDFTNILLQMVRMLGIPARYVSGYICPGNGETRGEGATHAWIEAYIPFYGWLGVDPTNNAIADEYHVRLAVGRNYKDCAPVSGVFKGNVESKMTVSVEVTRRDNLTPKKEDAISPDPKTGNSFQRNLELKQQSQQQQQ
ncbi:transglutaminase family protein [Tamlana crocina]